MPDDTSDSFTTGSTGDPRSASALIDIGGAADRPGDIVAQGLSLLTARESGQRRNIVVVPRHGGRRRDERASPVLNPRRRGSDPVGRWCSFGVIDVVRHPGASSLCEFGKSSLNNSFTGA
jgi:hypothetical protein